ncbi:hypothetical protein J437_LFUL005596 [Ladona fulva]|uniref:NADH dehydrogenase [ubiquinone] 1 alpha subcomplex subunit 1 n=1 Tax=Ladona fulva TaxID=123851 RepID=A0A8K0K057_LADFU|nr:hypothetical protein J437_LFUL005596 [Ladona fulva]
MWFEILPSFAVIVVAFTIPPVATYALNKTFLGNAFRRDVGIKFNELSYIRDHRITGDAYKPKGLESIPDE